MVVYIKEGGLNKRLLGVEMKSFVGQIYMHIW